jgi:hypothetical protein
MIDVQYTILLIDIDKSYICKTTKTYTAEFQLAGRADVKNDVIRHHRPIPKNPGDVYERKKKKLNKDQTAVHTPGR